VADEDYLAIVTDAADWKTGLPMVELRAPNLGEQLAALVERSLLS
jgi:hypothetical protein